MSIGFMSHVDFKKSLCRRVEFKGQGPQYSREVKRRRCRGGSSHSYMKGVHRKRTDFQCIFIPSLECIHCICKKTTVTLWTVPGRTGFGNCIFYMERHLSMRYEHEGHVSCTFSKNLFVLEEQRRLQSVFSFHQYVN